MWSINQTNKKLDDKWEQQTEGHRKEGVRTLVRGAAKNADIYKMGGKKPEDGSTKPKERTTK